MALQVGAALRRPTDSPAARPRAGRRPDTLRVALFVLILLDVSRLHQHYPILAVFRPMQVLAVLALFYSLANPKLLGDFRSWSAMWPARVVGGLGLVACFSVIFGISVGGAARYLLEDYVKVLIMAYLLMSTIRNARDLEFYVWAYVAACGLLVWMSLFVFGVSKANAEGIYRLQNLYLYDGNDVCVVLLAGLGLCLFTFQTSGWLGKLASAVIMIGIGVTIAKTGSRGGFLGLLAFGGAFLFMPARTSVLKRALMIAVLGLALEHGTPEGYWHQMNTLLAPTQDYNWSEPTGRRMIAKRGIGYMKSYPLFGVGISNFPRAEGTISQRAKDWRPDMPGIRWIAPHNTYIQVGAEMGVPALMLWSSLLIGGVVSSWRLRRTLKVRWPRRDREQRLLGGFTECLPLALIGFGVSAFFVSFAYLSPVYILAAYVIGMRAAVTERQKRDAPPHVVTVGTRARESLAAMSAYRTARMHR